MKPITSLLFVLLFFNATNSYSEIIKKIKRQEKLERKINELQRLAKKQKLIDDIAFEKSEKFDR